ncbi:hypothetical protein LPJGGPFB_03333 [Ensifer adhaerens]|nr:hypothetical protein [Ensifer adhaerens]
MPIFSCRLTNNPISFRTCEKMDLDFWAQNDDMDAASPSGRRVSAPSATQKAVKKEKRTHTP